jgi:transposase-like protein
MSPDRLSAHYPSPPDPEVTPQSPEKAKRRKFSASYKRQVLEETERLPEGQLGEYLRKNGLYASHLSLWRQQRRDGDPVHLEPKMRGRKRSDGDAKEELISTQKELERVREQLHRANLIVEVQKKILLLCEEFTPSDVMK